jgi:hypothetical protein
VLDSPAGTDVLDLAEEFSDGHWVDQATEDKRVDELDVLFRPAISFAAARSCGSKHQPVAPELGSTSGISRSNQHFSSADVSIEIPST